MDTNEQTTEEQNKAVNVKEEDLSYTKGSLGTKLDNADGRHKIL